MRQVVLGLILWGFIALPAMAGWGDWFKSQDQKDKEYVTGLVDLRRQGTIEKYHLIARAQSVEVLDYAWADLKGNSFKDSKDPRISVLLVQYVIRWAGPVNQGGMTEFVAAYDLKRSTVPVIAEEVISTNGIRNEDAAETAGAILGLLLNGGN